MGFFYWGEKNNPKSKQSGGRKPSPPPVERVSVSSLRHGHSPDKRKSNRGLLGTEGPPIDVDRSGKVIDGNDRLYYARQRGARTIRVRRWR